MSPSYRTIFFTSLIAITFFAVMGLGIASGWLMITLIAILVLFLLVGRHPLWLLMAIPLVIPLGKIASIPVGSQWMYDVTATELAIIATAGVLILSILFYRTPTITSLPPLAYILLGLWLFEVVSLFWIHDIATYLIAVRVLLFHIAVFVLATLIPRSEHDIWKALWALPALLLLISAQLIWVLSTFGGFQSQLLYGRNDVATPVGALAFVLAIIVLLVPPTIVLRLRPINPLIKIIIGCILLLAAGAAFIGLGKAALLSLAIGFTYAIARLQQWSTLWKTIIVACAAALLIWFIAPTAIEPLITRWQHVGSDASTSFRIEELKTGWTQFVRHPFSGVGAGNLKYYYSRFLRGYQGESNNIVIQLSAESGIVGLLAFLLIVGSFIHMVRSPHLTPAMRVAFESALLVAFVHGMVEATFIGLEYGVVFWYIAGLLAAATRVPK